MARISEPLRDQVRAFLDIGLREELAKADVHATSEGEGGGTIRTGRIEA